MITNVAALDAAIRKVCPIDGVNSNGSISYAEAATTSQKAAAQAIVAGWVDGPGVPQSVSMRQGREALIRRGYIATVDGYIAGMAGIEGDIARNEWDKSQVIERNRPLTLAMGQLLGLDAAGLDELFTFAATLYG